MLLCNPDESLLSQPIVTDYPSLANRIVNMFRWFIISKNKTPDISYSKPISMIGKSMNRSEAYKDLLPIVH